MARDPIHPPRHTVVKVPEARIPPGRFYAHQDFRSVSDRTTAANLHYRRETGATDQAIRELRMRHREDAHRAAIIGPEEEEEGPPLILRNQAQQVADQHAHAVQVLADALGGPRAVDDLEPINLPQEDDRRHAPAVIRAARHRADAQPRDEHGHFIVENLPRRVARKPDRYGFGRA